MKGSNRRRYLTEGELTKLIKAARKGRYGQRDATFHADIKHTARYSELSAKPVADFWR